jgi:hypothetical protein
VKDEQAAAILSDLLAAFPGQALEDEAVDMYVKQLAMLDSAESGQETALLLIQHTKAFPTIAEFRQEYFALRRRTGETEAKEDRSDDYEAVPPPDYVLNMVAGMEAADDEEAQAIEDGLAALSRVEEGRCDDCGEHSSDGGIIGERFQYGRFAVCRPHALSRLRAKLQIERSKAP